MIIFTHVSRKSQFFHTLFLHKFLQIFFRIVLILCRKLNVKFAMIKKVKPRKKQAVGAQAAEEKAFKPKVKMKSEKPKYKHKEAWLRAEEEE